MLIIDRIKPFPKCDIATDDKSLAAWCRWWRDALGLSDWVIDVRFVRHYELDDKYGRSTINIALKCATLDIKAQMDATDGDYNFDIEQTLVHELVHVKTWFLTLEDGLAGHLEEQCVDTLAWSLVNLRRMKRG